MQKILITGSNGLLGQKLVLHFTKDKKYQVVGFSRGENRLPKIPNYTYLNIDIAELETLQKQIQKIEPDIIINCAAMTNVDVCEENKTECDIVNVQAVKTLAEYCKTSNCKLLHLSTDFIFDGKKGFYSEDDLPNPINYYGLSKLKSEKILTKNLDNFVIIRTILVYGTTQNTNRGHIVSWVIDNLKQNKPIRVVSDQLRMPTMVNDLVTAIDLSLKKDAKGIFHISSNELFSILDIAKIVAKEFKLNTALIQPISTEELTQKANRPLKTGFNLDKAKKVLDFTSKSFIQQIKEYKANLK